MDDRETVDLIASGYEWVCPQCDQLNLEDTIPNGSVWCKACGGNFQQGDHDHCYE